MEEVAQAPPAPAGDLAVQVAVATADLVVTGGIFGGGSVAGQFGAGAFGGGQSNPMNETLYSDVNTSISGVAAVEPILQVSEGTKNQTVSF